MTATEMKMAENIYAGIFTKKCNNNGVNVTLFKPPCLVSLVMDLELLCSSFLTSEEIHLEIHHVGH